MNIPVAPISKTGWLGVAVIVLLTFAAVGVGSFVVLAPVGVEYRVEARDLVVRTKMGFWRERQRIPLDQITDAGVVGLQGGLRTKGTARPGYCVGQFTYDTIGRVWQATSCTGRVVLLGVKGWKRGLLLSPQDPDAFLSSLYTKYNDDFRKKNGNSAFTQTFETVLGWQAGSWWRALQALFGLMMLLPFLILCLPFSLGYRLEGATLRVRTLGGWKSYSLRQCRAQRYTPKRIWRTLGAGMPGAYSGRFREDGKRCIVHASRMDRLVLIEGPLLPDNPSLKRLMVSPEDPEAFLEELRALGCSG